MSAYTNVPKPTGTPYTNVPINTIDYPQYGYAIYGVSKYGLTNEYTNISKPTGGTSYGGMGTALMIPLTRVVTFTSNQYTNVPKPIT